MEFFERELPPVKYERPDNAWKFISEQVKRSKISRYNWNAVYGTTLTKAILTLKLKGLDKDQCVFELINNPTIQAMYLNNKPLAEDMINKIKISVYARYGEQNSAAKIKADFNGNGGYLG